MAWSLPTGLGCSNTPKAAGVAPGRSGAPVVDITAVKVFTRVGCSRLRCCAIIPPMDMPTTCACSIESASIRAAVSVAMSLSV